MSTDENKALFRRLIEEILNKGNLALIDELFSPDYVDHNPVPGIAAGSEGLKQMFAMFRSAFSDLRITVEDLIAEDDKVVGRVAARGTHRGELMGIAATGKQIDMGEIHIFRVVGGKAAEHWGISDDMGMMQQLGVLPAPGQS